MDYSVKENCEYLQRLLNSIQIGLSKADNGSAVEDVYIIEKLEKFALCLGYELTEAH